MKAVISKSPMKMLLLSLVLALTLGGITLYAFSIAAEKSEMTYDRFPIQNLAVQHPTGSSESIVVVNWADGRKAISSVIAVKVNQLPEMTAQK